MKGVNSVDGAVKAMKEACDGAVGAGAVGAVTITQNGVDHAISVVNKNGKIVELNPDLKIGVK